MVDPNPARGMPLQLQRYWLVGKGAAKIRWNIPGDFKRCVHHLMKYFPKDPKGLCNILHTKATGGPPGHGSAEKLLHHSAGLEEATALLAAMPMLGSRLWAGPLAPIGRPTGEPRRQRVFEHGALSHRVLPLPLAHRRVTADGHQGAVTVGRIMGLTYGPDHEGQDYAWGWGDWFDPQVIPEVTEAQYLVDQGVAGPSVDPGGKVMAALNPETGAEHMTAYTIGGATLVSIPAFAALRLVSFAADGDWPDDDPDMAGDYAGPSGDCGCNHQHGLDLGEEDPTFTVNTDGWRGLPLASRNAPFDNDDAVKRISAWAGVNAQGADVGKLRRAFLWRDPQLPETDPTSYRLPVGDIINGRLTLVFHAIYAAAALLSGAHGGLPGVSDQDRAQLRGVISNIYPEMATAFNDSSIRAPWDRSGQEGVQMAMEFQANANEPYGNVKYADPGYQQDGKKRYPIDNEEHVRAAWSYINQADNASAYTPEQLKAIKGRIKAAAKKYGISISDTASTEAEFASVAESQYPLTPPLDWFGNPNLTSRTPLTVDVDGRVYGHLAAWGECHRDVAMRECVMAPKSNLEYAPFHLGYVMTEEGDMLKVGKIVMDTRHAAINLGYSAAALHYDNTGDEVAVVRAGEDQFGIWVAGAVVPEATPKKVAKLRRSPLSGDWRRVQGNLELCAALAVNVPAFPVYAMEDEDRTALVAAGSVLQEDEEPVATEGDPLEAFFQALSSEEKDTRAQRLLDLEEDEWIYSQRERADRLMSIYAMDPSAAPVTPVAAPQAPVQPAPAAQAPVQAPGQAPVPGQPIPVPDAPEEVADPLNLTDDEMLAMQLNTRYSPLPEPGQGAEAPALTGDRTGAPATGASTAQAQAPVQTTVPVR